MNGLDVIKLVGVTAKGYHGVLESERRNGQDFVVDLTAWADLSVAASTDDLQDTVDYDLLAREIAALIEGEPLDLIETLCSRIADVALKHERIEEVEVTVHKPQAPITVPFQDVCITMRRRSS